MSQSIQVAGFMSQTPTTTRSSFTATDEVRDPMTRRLSFAWRTLKAVTTLTVRTLLLSVGAAMASTEASVTTGPTAVGKIGGPGHAGLYGWGVTTLLDGSILIGDYWNLRVLHYASDGTPLGSWISTTAPKAAQVFSPYG